jgi:hypothetical protein
VLQTRYDLATRGGRIEMSVRVVGNHKHLGGSLHWELITGTVLAALCVLSQLWMLQVSSRALFRFPALGAHHGRSFRNSSAWYLPVKRQPKPVTHALETL